MPYVLDESCYRVDKTVFPDEAEAKQRALESARILGRPISVYELQQGVLNFAFQVMPDGSVVDTLMTADPPRDYQVPSPSPAVLGMSKRQLLDVVATVMEEAGRPDLAAQLDRVTASQRRATAINVGLRNKKKLARVKEDVSASWRSGYAYEWSPVYREWMPRQAVTVKPNMSVSDVTKKMAQKLGVPPKHLGIEISQ